MNFKVADFDPKEGFIQGLSQALGSLDKNIRLIRLYTSNNPILQKHQKDLCDQFLHLLTVQSPIEVFVTPHELKTASSTVYFNENPRESFAFLLFNDGIRSLKFMVGLEPHELTTFVLTLSKRLQENRADVDTFTLLWEKEFPHIHHTVAETFVDEPDWDRTFEEHAQEQMQSFIQTPSHPPQVQGNASDPQVYDDFNITVTPQSMGKLFENRQTLSLEEISSIQKDIETCDKTERLILDYADMILSVLQEEADPGEFALYLNYLGQGLDACFKEGSFQNACLILEQVHAFPKRNRALALSEAEILKLSLGTIWDKPRLDLFLMSLNQAPNPNLEDIETLTRLIDPSALPYLLQKTLTVIEPQKHRALLRGIARLHKGDIGLFTTLLSHKQTETVKAGLYILSLIKNEKAIDKIAPLIDHADESISKEVISFLKNFRHPKSQALLLGLLGHPKEETRVMALRALSQVGDAQVAAKLGQHMVDENLFPKKSLTEKKHYFFAVAKMIGDEFIPFTTRLLAKKNWLNSPHVDDLHQCCAMALSQIGSDSAKAVLEKYAQSSSKKVNRYCEMALKQFGHKEVT